MTTTTTVSVQELVDRALAASTADGCIAIARHHTGANLRWANNTLTTNGQMRSVEVTVIAFVRQAGGPAAASVSGSATTVDQVVDLAAAADAAARAADPATDAQELVAGEAAADWEEPPADTDVHVFDE
jgi:predicted Zn-dependent protease